MARGVWGGVGQDKRRQPKPELALRNFRHGLTGHPLYPIWRDMMNRCHSPKNKSYKDYGGRGIFVCEQWRGGPEAFLQWAVAQGPIPAGHSLDRYPDKNGPYSPTNCRFASPSEQNHNMRSNVWVEYGGERLIFKDFVAKYGVVSYDCAKSRYKRGWGPIEAAITPKGSG
jgi:hypothetical protein